MYLQVQYNKLHFSPCQLVKQTVVWRHKVFSLCLSIFCEIHGVKYAFITHYSGQVSKFGRYVYYLFEMSHILCFTLARQKWRHCLMLFCVIHIRKMKILVLSSSPLQNVILPSSLHLILHSSFNLTNGQYSSYWILLTMIDFNLKADAYFRALSMEDFFLKFKRRTIPYGKQVRKSSVSSANFLISTGEIIPLVPEIYKILNLTKNTANYIS